MPGGDFLAQAAHRADRNDSFDAEFLKRIDIRAKIDFSRQPAMSPAVARLKYQFDIAQPAANQSIRGFAEGCFYRYFPHPLDFGHLVEPAAADDAYGG